MPDAPAEHEPVSDPASVGHWRITALVAGVVLLAYLLLLNPYWTPGGDSELFLAAARSIARGDGYRYNGEPVSIAPPAWPYVLAGVMAVSPTFLLIKLVTLTLMAGAWALAHRVLLRLGPPAWAAWATVLGALLVPTYSLTFWLHSEPLFCALAWAAALMAVRLAEGRGRGWAMLGLILCCAGMSATRWTSGLQWGLIAALLLGGVRWHGRVLWSRPTGARAGVGLGVAWLVTLLVFLLFFWGAARVAEAAMAVSQELPVTTQDAENRPPSLADNTIYDGTAPWVERFARLGSAGHWVAWALWYPTRFAGGLGATSWIPQAVGWLAIALLGVAAWRSLIARGSAADWPVARFAWVAVLGYVFLLAVIWPLPNARYLVPAGPLVAMGVLWGCRGVGEMFAKPRIGRGLGVVFIASVLAANVPMFALDVAVQRRGDALFGGSPARYYAAYEAGLHESLLRAVRHLRANGLADGELAVSERYENLNRTRFSKGGPRNAVMLLDRRVVSPPDVYSFEPTKIPARLYRRGHVLPGGFAAWAATQDPPVRYYLYQQPSEPWRLWHFRVPASLQARLTGKPVAGESFGWLLFSADDGFRAPVALPETYDAPTRIPGL